MNDGIYYPFSEVRFQKYQDGINRLIENGPCVRSKIDSDDTAAI